MATLVSWKRNRLSCDHTNDLKEEYRKEYYPDQDIELYENTWFKLLCANEKYQQLIKEHIEKKNILWHKNMKEEFKWVDSDEIETILMKYLNVEL